VEQVRTAHQAYELKDYPQAVRLTSPVIRDYPDCPDTAEAWYIRGLSHLRMNHRPTARADLEQTLVRSQRPELTALAQAQLGNMDFDEGGYDRAASYYAQAEVALPSEPPTDRILYQYGLSLERTGRFAEAKFAFAEVFTKYPRSPVADAARRHYKWPHRYFAVQCGAFSKLDSARRITNRLAENGHAARIVKDDAESGTRYVIQAGRFPRYADAKAAAAAIRPMVDDVFIVP
jgi:tetratricopeptide (TPR) repeat protein